MGSAVHPPVLINFVLPKYLSSYHHGSRQAKKPEKKHNAQGDEHDSAEEEEDDEFDDDELNWPSKAYHNEDAFGYIFDSGALRLFRYQFKDQANPKIVPGCGDDIAERNSSSWCKLRLRFLVHPQDID